MSEQIIVQIDNQSIEIVEVAQQGMPGIPGAAGATNFNQLTNVPSSFPPSAHSHPATDITPDATHRFVTDTEKTSYAGQSAAAIAAIRNGVATAGDDLTKLYALIQAINSIIGGSTPDGNSTVDTVAELLAVFQNFSESVNLLTALNSKINSTDALNALTQTTAGKVLDARAGKALKDLIDGLTTNKANLASPNFTGHPTGTTEAASKNSTRLATTEFVQTAVNWNVVEFDPEESPGQVNATAADSGTLYIFNAPGNLYLPNSDLITGKTKFGLFLNNEVDTSRIIASGYIFYARPDGSSLQTPILQRNRKLYIEVLYIGEDQFGNQQWLVTSATGIWEDGD